MLDPPIEVQQLRLILQNDFRRAGQPIIQIFFRGGRLAEFIEMRHFRHGWPIEIPLDHRIAHIGFIFLAVAHEEPMLRPVGGGAEFHAFFFHRLLPGADQIPLGPHLGSIPLGEAASIHLETVMVLRHRHHIARTGPAEQVCPGGGVEVFCPEHGNKILVAKILVGAVGFQVMLVSLFPGYVHIARIPFAVKGRHAVQSPMDENAQPALPDPGRHRGLCQRIPGGLIRSCGNDFIYLAQNFLFRHGCSSSIMVIISSRLSAWAYSNCIISSSA